MGADHTINNKIKGIILDNDRCCKKGGEELGGRLKEKLHFEEVNVGPSLIIYFT